MNGKILIISSSDSEEQLFRQIEEFVSKEMSCIPTIITKQNYDFSINPHTRIFSDKTGELMKKIIN